MRHRKIIKCALITLLLCSPSSPKSQTGPRRVSALVFRGIENINREFLAEETSLRKGDIYSPSRMKEDLRRLENLKLFSSIKADTVNMGTGGVKIVYTLEETLHWILAPFIFKDDNYGFIYGVQFAHANLFGKKYTTYCAGNGGGLEGGQINFGREMTNSRRYGFEMAAERDESEHPVLDYWRQNHILALSFRRRIGAVRRGYSIQQYAGLSTSLEVKKFKLDGISIASDRSDVVIKTGIFYQYDDTDIRYNPTRGRRIGLTLGYWNINGTRGIESLFTSLSMYKSLSTNLVLAGNLSSEIYADPLPVYYRNFMGGYNFRGCYYGDHAGDSYITSSFELRLLPRWKFNFLKSFFEPAAAIFADAAIVGGHDDFYERTVHYGYGISIGILTPYVSPFFHLAINENEELIDYFSLQNNWKF